MTTLLFIFGLIGTVFTIYFIITSLGGFVFGKKYALPEAPDAARIAAVVAARNEAAVLPALIQSLLAQDYPRALYDVYVVPNNCTDDTEAVACAAGAKILHCPDPVRRKGDALRQAFAQLSATGNYDAYCVFDADNLVHPGFLHQVNNAFQAGYEAGQGYRDSKNPFDSWVAGGTSVFYWFMSRVFNGSRARLGLNSHINGTGFMVTDAAFRRMGWPTQTLTEDLEFTGLCGLNDCRIAWMPLARVYDEQPITFHDSAVQRRRWTAGSLQCTRRYALKLMTHGTPNALDIGCVFTANLMNYIGVVSMVLSWIQFGRMLMNHSDEVISMTALSALTFWLGMMLGAAIILHMEGRLCRQSVPTLLLFPLFMFTWMPINLYASFTPPPKWRMVKHTRALNLSDMEGKQP